MAKETYTRIIGTGSCLPPRIIKNSHFLNNEFYKKINNYSLVFAIGNKALNIAVKQSVKPVIFSMVLNHKKFNVDKEKSDNITDKINQGDLSEKPGWIRLSLHPTTTNDEAKQVLNGVQQVIQNANEWKNEYQFDAHSGDFVPNKHTTQYLNLSSFNPRAVGEQNQRL